MNDQKSDERPEIQTAMRLMQEISADFERLQNRLEALAALDQGYIAPKSHRDALKALDKRIRIEWKKLLISERDRLGTVNVSNLDDEQTQRHRAEAIEKFSSRA